MKLGFDTKKLINKPAEMVNTEFREFMTDRAKNLSKAFDSRGNPLYSLLFVYYSGHGIDLNGQVVGIDIDGQYISLETFVYEIACKKNTTVIAFFDCCRS